MSVILPATAADADAAIGAAGSCVLNFCAEWCEPCVHTNAVFAELASEHAALRFVQIDGDTFPALCERYELESVPAFLFVSGGSVIDRVMGADVAELTGKVRQHAVTAALHSTAPIAPIGAPPPAPAPAPLDERLRALTRSSAVMLFMKGNPAQPRCGFRCVPPRSRRRSSSCGRHPFTSAAANAHPLLSAPFPPAQPADCGAAAGGEGAVWHL